MFITDRKVRKESVGMKIIVAGEELELYPQRGIFWPAQKMLLLADLHFGKINHFRKAGIAVPGKVNDRNIELLIDLIELTKPARIVCLGDLFHSHYNPEWETIGEVIKHFVGIVFELVLGNHDIMSQQQYTRKGILLHDQLDVGPFHLTHHPEENWKGGYNLAGHLHPGVQLIGMGKQSETLPCFYFGERQGFLPAFGMFTGLAKVYPKRKDRIFVIADNKIFPVS